MADAIEVDRQAWREIVRRLNRLPQTAKQEIREAARAIAEDEAARIRSAGGRDDEQSDAVASFVRARSDRVPAIVAGGRKKAGVSGGATVSQLFYGAEFGGQQSEQAHELAVAFDRIQDEDVRAALVSEVKKLAWAARKQR